jgi:hypothetical protein
LQTQINSRRERENLNTTDEMAPTPMLSSPTPMDTRFEKPTQHAYSMSNRSDPVNEEKVIILSRRTTTQKMID